MNRPKLYGQRGKRYARDIARYARKNTILLILAGIFLLGVALGALAFRAAGAETAGAIARLLEIFKENRAEQGVLANAAAMLSASAAFLAFLLVCGFCAVSQPAILAVPAFRGLGFGFSAASLYAAHGISAMGYVALMILPDMLLSSLAILLCSREALRLSGSFWHMMLGEKSTYPLKIYLGRFAACAVLCAISAVLAAVLNFAFANAVVLG
jgi:hypothetical protein